MREVKICFDFTREKKKEKVYMLLKMKSINREWLKIRKREIELKWEEIEKERK